jgi:septum formation protein
LRAAGVEPDVVVSGVEESGVYGEAEEVALELARRKAATVAARLDDKDDRSKVRGPAFILGCDSVLAFDGQVLGKPSSPLDATQRWRQMRGRSGVLHTGHCVIEAITGREASAVGSTNVHFAEVSDEEIDAYVATGEPLNVAGAFTVDGLGGAFIEAIEGDYHNVVGLSLPVLRHLLLELGVTWTALWEQPS